MVRRIRTDLRIEVDWQDAGNVEGAWPAQNADYPPQDITSRVASAFCDTGSSGVRTIRVDSLRTSVLTEGTFRVDNRDGAYSSGVGHGATYDRALLTPHLARVVVGADPSGRDVWQAARAEILDAGSERAILQWRSARRWDENPRVEAGIAVNGFPIDLATTAVLEALNSAETSTPLLTDDIPSVIFISEAVDVARARDYWTILTTRRPLLSAGGGSGGTVASTCRHGPTLWTIRRMRRSMMTGGLSPTAPKPGMCRVSCVTRLMLSSGLVSSRSGAVPQRER